MSKVVINLGASTHHVSAAFDLHELEVAGIGDHRASHGVNAVERERAPAFHNLEAQRGRPVLRAQSRDARIRVT